MMIKNNLILLLSMVMFLSCNASHLDDATVENIKNVTEQSIDESKQKVSKQKNKDKKMETAIIGGGCFWCTEAQYLALDGVEKVISGYAGGETKYPSYKEVCTGTTGHAEVIKIEYDADKISYEEILQAFFVAHDPTQLNRQGADVGTQYRSTIMPQNDEQKAIAEAIIKEFNDKKIFSHPVVTTVEPLDVFYPAEEYHQNYYAQNGTNPYCSRSLVQNLKSLRRFLMTD